VSEMKKENIIICPECGAKIYVNEILYRQLEEQIKKESKFTVFY